RASCRQPGFTLVELMTAVAILAIIAGIAIPAFDNFLLSARLRAYANDFVAAVLLAKSEAKKRTTAVVLCKSNNGLTCSASGGWEQGWIVASGSSVIRYQQATDSGYRIFAAVDSFTFQANGFGSTPATVTVCRSSPAADFKREVTVS